ncbi:MAG: aminodeoxychorismate lyase [Gammaproteobacteria bacterium]
MTTRYWIDGEPGGDWPIDDRGLRYADGVFETMRVAHGEIAHFARHYRRLERGCGVLGLDVPNQERLERDISLMDLPQDAVVRLTVTRAGGGRGYTPEAASGSRRLWELHEHSAALAQWQENGIVLQWLTTTLGEQPLLAGIKHLGRLEQVMAARELATMDADEGLLCDTSGHVVEAVSSNVFVRSGPLLFTPPLDRCGVAGIARGLILDSGAALGFDIQEKRLRRSDIALADEVFLTNSVRGAQPVRQLASVAFSDFSAAQAVHDILSGSVLLP